MDEKKVSLDKNDSLTVAVIDGHRNQINDVTLAEVSSAWDHHDAI